MKKTAFLLLWSVLAAPAFAGGKPAPIVFFSDFGLTDDAVSQCKGVISGVSPLITVTDGTHQIPAFDIKLASFFLAQSAHAWPAGTVFLAVIDPGVGTKRSAIALKTKSGHYFVGPDNGLFTMPARELGIERTRVIRNPAFTRKNITSTFHGRDIFAPAAAHIAKNPDDFDKIGPQLNAPLLINWPASKTTDTGIEGSVLFIEPSYGNVWTDISQEQMDSLGIAKNQDLAVEIGGNRLLVPFKNTFGDVLKGLPLAYINSRGLLSFAVNTGNFAEKYGATDDSTVKLELSSATFSDMGLLAKNNVFFDLRYATDNNFTGEKIYPSGKCYLRRNAGAALLKASEAAEKEGFALCVLDCYRPAYVQEIFWSILPDERYVANPQKGSRHGRGLAVDVSACDLSGKWLEMPTGFDDFTGKASSDAKDVSAAARKNREKLQKVMKQAGFDIFPTEWWHFDYPGWEQTPVMNFPLE